MRNLPGQMDDSVQSRSAVNAPQQQMHLTRVTKLNDQLSDLTGQTRRLHQERYGIDGADGASTGTENLMREKQRDTIEPRLNKTFQSESAGSEG